MSLIERSLDQLPDDQRQVLVLVVESMKQSQLLLAVAGVVGCVDATDLIP